VRVYRNEKDAFGGNFAEGDQRVKGGFYPERNIVVLIAENHESTEDVLGTHHHGRVMRKGYL